MLARIAFASVAALAVSAAVTAASADGYRGAPFLPVAASPWAGFYVGAQIGWIGSDDSLRFDNGAPTLDISRDGFVGGGHIGYNFQSGAWVFGIEGDFEGTDLSAHSASAFGITSEGSLDSNWEASIRGRIGVAVDRALWYATGGVAWTNVDVRGGPLGGPLISNSDTLTGWTVGAGVEYALAAPLTMRVEYRYSDFGRQDFSLAPTFPGVTQRAELTENAVRFGLSYHFSAPLGPAYAPVK